MTADLKPRERAVLEFIRAQVMASGVAPSLREISAAIGMKSPTAALYVLDALEGAGLIRRSAAAQKTRTRGIEVVKTEYQHGADCACLSCSEVRHCANTIQALRVETEITSGVRLTNIRPLSVAKRAKLLRISLNAAACNGAATPVEVQ